MKKIFLVLVFSASLLTAQNNMWPLNIGNQYQYFEYGTHQVGYSYALDPEIVIKDTIINQVKYYSFNNSGDFFRYDKDSNKAFLWFNGVEGLYCDFNLSNGSNFSQFKPFSHNYEDVTISIGMQNLFGTERKTVEWTTAYGFSRNYETFGDSLGIVARGSSSFGPGPDSERNSWLINAILYDSLGNFTYYSNGYEPVITFQPFSAIGDNVFHSFSLQVDHHYNGFSSFLGNLSDGIVYIDSVLIEFYYQKDLVITTTQRSYAGRTPVTNTYNFIVQLDTALLRNDYKLMYRIVVKDKSIIPVYKFSPDGGYYQAVYNPTSVEDREILNNSFSLSQNYPNPFNPSTTITYSIPLWGEDERGGLVTLKVYDILGNEVATLVNEEKPAGNHEIEFNAENLSSGIYFYQLKTGDFIQTKKMLLLR